MIVQCMKVGNETTKIGKYITKINMWYVTYMYE